MKRTLMVPVILLAHTLLFGILITVFLVLFEQDTSAVINHGGTILFFALFPAVLYTTVRALFRPIVPVLYILLVACTLIAGVVGAVLIDTHVIGPPLSDPGIRRNLPEGVILHGPEYSLRIGDATGVALSDVLIFHRRHIPTIQYVPEATWNAQTWEIVFPGEENLSAKELSEVLWWQIPPGLESLTRQVQSIYLELRSFYQSRAFIDFLVYGLSLVLAMVVMWTPLRLFRWPLLNVVIAVAYLRLLFAVPNLVLWAIGGDATVPLLPDWFPMTLRSYLVPSVWGLFFLLLLGIALFLPPVSRWRREVESEGGAH